MKPFDFSKQGDLDRMVREYRKEYGRNPTTQVLNYWAQMLKKRTSLHKLLDKLDKSYSVSQSSNIVQNTTQSYRTYYVVHWPGQTTFGTFGSLEDAVTWCETYFGTISWKKIVRILAVEQVFLNKKEKLQ